MESLSPGSLDAFKDFQIGGAEVYSEMNRGLLRANGTQTKSLLSQTPS